VTSRDPLARTPRLDRRTFNRLLLGAALGVASGCAGPGRETDHDRLRLANQRSEERARSGRGPYGRQVMQGYRGFAELPWYELREGRLVCVDESVPPAIDIHAHLGMSVLFAPDVDLMRETPRVRYLLDCDAHDPPLPFDLDVYANANFDDAELRSLRRWTLLQGTFGSGRAKTHTLPNLRREMDACRVTRACLLPIEVGLWFGDDLTERWLDAIDASGTPDRFVRCASVHPHDEDAPERLRAFAERGARMVKLHPAVQGFYADEDAAMRVYQACAELGLVVFFHSGRAGIEPASARRFNLVRALEPAIAAFPQLPFVLGHAGARDVAEVIPLAKRYENAWLGIHGQGISSLHRLISEVGAERLLFGTDWPFYALAATHAKVLMVTRERFDARAAILHDNAERLFSRPGAPGDGAISRRGASAARDARAASRPPQRS
jgi:hypothetical protein